MITCRIIPIVLSVSLFVFGRPYKELVPNFNRLKSPVTIREISSPTYANLDYAAYSKNPVLFNPVRKKPRKTSQNPSLESATFNGTISDVKDNINEISLSEDERNAPLAWKPLVKKLWNVVKDQEIQNIAGRIDGYKWGDPSVFQPFQQVTDLYIHSANDTAELWVKIEFNPWVPFADVFDDEDDDGFPEIYGKLTIDRIHSDSLAKAVSWIRQYYSSHVCSKQEIQDWVTSLASYWYPTRNSDIVDMSGYDVWPNRSVKRSVRKKLKKVAVQNPIAVIEAKPFSPKKPVYNVFVVKGLQTAGEEQQSTTNNALVDKQIDTTVSDNFVRNDKRFENEIAQYGPYSVWAEKNSGVYAGVQNYLNTLPQSQMGIIGENNWLFFKKSLEYILGGDLSGQKKEKNPIVHIREFNHYCKANNINMIFVPIPNKEEVYFDKLPLVVGEFAGYINPNSRKALKDLQDAGVEVIDLLPAFIEAKEYDKDSSQTLYQKNDTHWTNRGLQIAAELIAQRIQQYRWYAQVEKQQYTTVDTSFERLGDIVDRIPADKKAEFVPAKLKAKQVRGSDGKPYRANPSSPVMLIGDSFTGVFESVDCKSAGVGAHIAHKTGCPVDIITSWGGGPMVRHKALRMRKDYLPQKRLIVYMMVSRDLYNYSQGWKPLGQK